MNNFNEIYENFQNEIKSSKKLKGKELKNKISEIKDLLSNLEDIVKLFLN
jgi:hypothetical protein